MHAWTKKNSIGIGEPINYEFWGPRRDVNLRNLNCPWRVEGGGGQDPAPRHPLDSHTPRRNDYSDRKETVSLKSKLRQI